LFSTASVNKRKLLRQYNNEKYDYTHSSEAIEEFRDIDFGERS